MNPPLDPSLAPVLVFDCVKADEEEEATSTKLVYSITKGQLLPAKGLDRFVDNVRWVTPQGWLLMLDRWTGGAFLCSPFASLTVHLPPLDQEESILIASSRDDTRCFLSTSQPTDPGCIVLVVHTKEPTFCYCRPGSSQWYKHEYRPEQIDDDGDREDILMAMASLVGAGGKFYVHIDDDKMAVLEFCPDPTFKTIKLTSRPRHPGCCFIRSIGLESCGDLFMLHFCYTLFCDRRILSIEVQKLDWSTRTWLKVSGLGVNRVFFIQWTQFAASMTADELGLKADCIYFTKEGDKGLYIHDLQQGTTTLLDPGPDVPSSLEPMLLTLADVVKC